MIRQRILPIIPGMCAGALGVFVWGFIVQKAAMQFAVGGDQEVVHPTIEFDGQRVGLHFIRHVHHRVVVVEGWIFRFWGPNCDLAISNGFAALRGDIPMVGIDVQGATHAANGTKELRIAGGEVQGAMPTHTQATNDPAGFFFDAAVSAIHLGDDLFGDETFILAGRIDRAVQVIPSDATFRQYDDEVVFVSNAVQEAFVGWRHQPIAEFAIASVQQVHGWISSLATLVTSGGDHGDFDFALQKTAGDFNGIDLGGMNGHTKADAANGKQKLFEHDW